MSRSLSLDPKDESLDSVTAAVTAAAAEVAHVAAAALQKVAASASGRQLASDRSFHASLAGELPAVDEDSVLSPTSVPVATAASRSEPDGAATAAAPPEAGASRQSSAGSQHGGSQHGSTQASVANVAPHGALRLSVALLRASTLRTHLGVSADPACDNSRQATIQGMSAVQSLSRVLHHWRGRGPHVVEGQRGCLFVHVRCRRSPRTDRLADGTARC